MGPQNCADLTNTTTDRAFEAVGLAAIHAKYKTIEELNKEWGTSFPGPAHYGDPMGMVFSPVLGMARESLSLPVLDDASLEKAMGPLNEANIRWGGAAGFFAPDEPTKFQNWGQVRAVIERYYKELGEVTSTRGWNVSSWCVFRNFMDETFADAVKRAADVCKAEDPHALCATEGGQAPFAFGWYNYEQVVRAVDVIEPYNIGELRGSHPLPEAGDDYAADQWHRIHAWPAAYRLADVWPETSGPTPSGGACSTTTTEPSSGTITKRASPLSMKPPASLLRRRTLFLQPCWNCVLASES